MNKKVDLFNEELEDSRLVKLIIFLSIFSIFITVYFRTKTLRPWNDEIVSLVSNLNFYFDTFDFIGPYETRYYISYSPKLTAGPLSALGGMIAWIFTKDIYILRFMNFIYLFFIGSFFSIYLFKKYSFNKNYKLLLVVLFVTFSITNTSWWYSILYFLPETVCSLIFISSVILFKKNRYLSLFLLSFVVFFGDFLTVLMFGGFYLGTIIYEKSFINIFKDSFVILTPPIVWIFLVLNFSEFSFTDYSMEYFRHYFQHPSGGEVNLSLNSIVNNFLDSEVKDWGIADFLRVMLSPLLLTIILIKNTENEFISSKQKYQIFFSLFFIYMWFWLLSPAKSIIYSGLFTTFTLIANSYLLVFNKKNTSIEVFFSLLIYSFFFSSVVLTGFFMIVVMFLLFNKSDKLSSKNLLIVLLIFLFSNQLNQIYEISLIDTFDISLIGCEDNLRTQNCLSSYYK